MFAAQLNTFGWSMYIGYQFSF